MEPLYMQDFLNNNFSLRCIKDRYYFRCELAFCSHCCPNHWVHHPPHVQQHSIAQIRSIGGHIMINAEDSRGAGYDWRRIQWFRFHGHRWMHLQRPHVPVPNAQYPYSCIACHDKRKSNFDFCAVTCQVNHVPDGKGIDQATHLLAADWAQLDCDTYCTRCRKAFASAYCDSHLELHHPNQVAATIEVFHHQGWVLVAAEQEVIPHRFFEGVQVMVVDGVLMCPIRSRPLQQQALPIADWMHPCGGQQCYEGVPLGAQFCSIFCRRATVP